MIAPADSVSTPSATVSCPIPRASVTVASMTWRLTVDVSPSRSRTNSWSSFSRLTGRCLRYRKLPYLERQWRTRWRRSRLQGQAARHGDPVRGIQHRRQPWVRERGHQPTRPPRLPSLRSAAGGSRSASSATRTRARCRSPPTAAAEAAPAPVCGRRNCSGWPTTLGFRSRSATSRPAPRSGTKSSTASGACSARTGVGGRREPA
jgi:hypothetical protein